MYDICAHSNLPTSPIIALGLLKKEGNDQFCIGGKNIFLDIWHFTTAFWQF